MDSCCDKCLTDCLTNCLNDLASCDCLFGCCSSSSNGSSIHRPHGPVASRRSKGSLEFPALALVFFTGICGVMFIVFTSTGQALQSFQDAPRPLLAVSAPK